MPVATVNRSNLSAGTYAATITVESDATQGNPTATIDVQMTVGGATIGDVGTLFVLVLDQDTLDTVNQTVTSAAQGYAFSLSPTTPGTYFLVAGTDRDNDDVICDIEDACGFYPAPVTITPGSDTPDVTFVVGELSSPQASDTVVGLQGRRFRLVGSP